MKIGVGDTTKNKGEKPRSKGDVKCVSAVNTALMAGVVSSKIIMSHLKRPKRMKMTERRLQQSSFPSTFEFHEHRERAPHLEQSWQNGRLYAAAKLIRKVKPASVVDLGCGDGGLLSLITEFPSWGYDFAPNNAAGWPERGVTAELKDVFNTDFDGVKWGELAVVTEVLEHLDDPHAAVHDISRHSKWIVASVPHDEQPGEHVVEGCHEHIYSWDTEGFRALIGAHFDILEYRRVDWNQIVLGRSRYI
jgi:SAM-dependent methyltransferase